MEKELRSGDVIGVVPKETMENFVQLEQKRMEAWKELGRVNTEELNLFEQLERDLGLAKEYKYSIRNATGEIILKRKKSESEMAIEAKWREVLGRGGLR